MRRVQERQAFHALRLAISDALQDGVREAEAATAGISKATAAGRNVPGLDDMANAARHAVSNTPDGDPAVFHVAKQAAAGGRWAAVLENAYADAAASLVGTSDKMAHAASRKAATDAFFEAFGRDAVGAARSVRYANSKTRPSAHFIRMYRRAHHDMKAATKGARGPDMMNGRLAVGRLDEICAGAIARAAEESRDSVHICAAILAVLGRAVMEDNEESTAEAAGRAADAITRAVAGEPRAIIVGTVLGDMVPKISHYSSRRRAHDAAVREIHKICTDMLTDAVGMCVVEALYEAFMAGAYRTTADKAFFRSNYRNALESACAFNPRKDVAGFKKGVSLPTHTVIRWWMDNALRYLADADCAAAAESQDNTAVMAFYEAAYEAAYESASQASAATRAGGRK